MLPGSCKVQGDGGSREGGGAPTGKLGKLVNVQRNDPKVAVSDPIQCPRPPYRGRPSSRIRRKVSEFRQLDVRLRKRAAFLTLLFFMQNLGGGLVAHVTIGFF